MIPSGFSRPTVSVTTTGVVDPGVLLMALLIDLASLFPGPLALVFQMGNLLLATGSLIACSGALSTMGVDVFGMLLVFRSSM